VIEYVVAPTYQRARSYCEVDREPRCSVRDHSQVRVLTRPDQARGYRLEPDDKVTVLRGHRAADLAWLALLEYMTYLERMRDATREA
jgi:hypothetical protein